MFAVVILGIGFIMVACIFPVALEQTRSNSDENIANQLAVSCIHAISSTTSAADYPDNSDGTLPMQAFAAQPKLWAKIDDGLINSCDPRYACVPFYYKSKDGTVQITVIVVRRWIHGGYTSGDSLNGELVPRGVGNNNISVIVQSDGTQAVKIGKDQTLNFYRTLGENSFLLITSGDVDMIGRTLRVGRQIDEDADYVTWSLRSDGGLGPGESCSEASAQVIGRDWVDPASDTAGYTGPSQDLAVYTTFLGQTASH